MKSPLRRITHAGPRMVRAVPTRSLCAIVATAVGVGCAGEPLPPSYSRRDPANPQALEVRADNAVPPTAAPTAVDPMQHSETSEGDAGVVYTCSMHSEVRQSAPGRCPKCGMTLVPKKP